MAQQLKVLAYCAIMRTGAWFREDPSSKECVENDGGLHQMSSSSFSLCVQARVT